VKFRWKCLRTPSQRR